MGRTIGWALVIFLAGWGALLLLGDFIFFLKHGWGEKHTFLELVQKHTSILAPAELKGWCLILDRLPDWGGLFLIAFTICMIVTLIDY